MPRITTALSAALLLVAITAAAASGTAARQARVTIRHQTSHCHAWSVDGGSFAAHISLKLGTGGSITFRNNDVMPHRLIEANGPTARFLSSPSMSHMGATLKVTFPRAGTYTFRTEAGEDYMAGVKTTGEDNILTLKVVVS
jgi:plastocyanin